MHMCAVKMHRQKVQELLSAHWNNRMNDGYHLVARLCLGYKINCFLYLDILEKSRAIPKIRSRRYGQH